MMRGVEVLKKGMEEAALSSSPWFFSSLKTLTGCRMLSNFVLSLILLSLLKAGIPLEVTTKIGNKITNNITVEPNANVSIIWTIKLNSNESFRGYSKLFSEGVSQQGEIPLYSWGSPPAGGTYPAFLKPYFSLKSATISNQHAILYYTIRQINTKLPYQKLKLVVKYLESAGRKRSNDATPSTIANVSTENTTTTTTTPQSNTPATTTLIIPSTTTTSAPSLKVSTSFVYINILEGPTICGSDMDKRYELSRHRSSYDIYVDSCGYPKPEIKWSVVGTQTSNLPPKIYPPQTIDGTFLNISGSGWNKTFQKTRFGIQLTTDHYWLCGRTLRYDITGYKQKKIWKEAEIYMEVKPLITDITVIRSSGCMLIQWNIKDTGLCQVGNYNIRFYNNTGDIISAYNFKDEKNEKFYVHCKNIGNIKSLELSTLNVGNIQESTAKLLISSLPVGGDSSQGNDSWMKAAVVILAVLLAIAIIIVIAVCLWMKRQYRNINYNIESSGKATMPKDNFTKKISDDSDDQEMYELPSWEAGVTNTGNSRQQQQRSVKNEYTRTPEPVHKKPKNQKQREEKHQKHQTQTNITQKKKKTSKPNYFKSDSEVYQNHDVIETNQELTKKKKPKMVPIPLPKKVVKKYNSIEQQEIYQNFSVSAEREKEEEQSIYENP